MCHAVRKVSGRHAASSKDSFEGLGSRLCRGTHRYSAYPPRTSSPMIWYLRHSTSSPDRHFSQAPHDRPGFTSTSVPTATSFTSAPTASTTPATSLPSTWGSSSFSPGHPVRTHTSRWLSATAFTLTRTSFAVGSGIGRSNDSSTSGPPWRRKAMALMG